MTRTDHKQFYTREAENYEATRYGSRYGRLFRALQQGVVEQGLTNLAPGARLLDVAAGTGQSLPAMLRPGRLVVASDLTPAMLLVARQRYADPSVVVHCVADAMRLPYADASFDAVVSSRFLHLFESTRQQMLIEEMARVLAPGGTLIVDFYSANARRIFWPLVFVYRTIFRKRPENDYRVSLREARRMIERSGLRIARQQGIGNFLLVPFLWLSQPTLWRAGVWLGRHFTSLSEQFGVVAEKR